MVRFKNGNNGWEKGYFLPCSQTTYFGKIKPKKIEHHSTHMFPVLSVNSKTVLKC